MTFQAGGTVIISATVRNLAGTLVNPANSMVITIVDSTGTSVVTAAAMTYDDTGLYHYDYTSSATAARGEYQVRIKATDGSRITIEPAVFPLE